MKTLTIVNTILLVAIVFFSYYGLSEVHTQKLIENRDSAPFSLRDGSYSGWQMGCNYAPGYSKDKQEVLDCANTLVYTLTAESPSVSYFDPDDDKKNAQYCPNVAGNRGNVAEFSATGRFIGCFNW